jgi:hypothetical protein
MLNLTQNHEDLGPCNYLVFNVSTNNSCCRHVSGSNLLVCGKHAYNQYHDCKDTNSYLSGDQINDVISLYAEKVRYHAGTGLSSPAGWEILLESRFIHSFHSLSYNRSIVSSKASSAPSTI